MSASTRQARGLRARSERLLAEGAARRRASSDAIARFRKTPAWHEKTVRNCLRRPSRGRLKVVIAQLCVRSPGR
ncbi:MAG: hypothetical protein ACE5FS_14955, partial [Paracoccaceae bacterium]